MHYIVYISSAITSLNQEELRSILIKSRKNNEALDITGMLLYSNGNIIQILEGEKDSVQTTFQKIENDYRHVGVLKLADGVAVHRLFPEWSMGFQSLSDKDFLDLAGYINLKDREFLPTSENDEDMIFTLLKGFVESTLTHV